MGGPLFKRNVAKSDNRASSHLHRGFMPIKFAQHSGPWWLARALAASPNLVNDIDKADVVFVDDFCYVAWSEAKLHNGMTWGPSEDMYVDPDAYLAAAYDRLSKHRVFQRRSGANFVFFHSHPMLPVNRLACQPAFGQSLHIAVEYAARAGCGAEPGKTVSRPFIVPYAAFPLLPTPDADPPRPKLIYFRATCGGNWVGKALRRAVASALRDTPNSSITCAAMDWEDAAHHEMGESRFCLVVAGDTPSSRRLSEAVLMGCVPIFLGPPFPAMPLASVLHYDYFSMTFRIDETGDWLPQGSPAKQEQPGAAVDVIPIKNLKALPGVLSGVGRLQYEKLAHHLAVVRRLFTFVPEADPGVVAGVGAGANGRALGAAGLVDVTYARMCYHAQRAEQQRG